MPAQRQPRLVKIFVDLEPRQMVGADRQERGSGGFSDGLGTPARRVLAVARVLVFVIGDHFGG